jgi:hypothetical protein
LLTICLHSFDLSPFYASLTYPKNCSSGERQNFAGLKTCRIGGRFHRLQFFAASLRAPGFAARVAARPQSAAAPGAAPMAPTHRCGSRAQARRRVVTHTCSFDPSLWPLRCRRSPGTLISPHTARWRRRDGVLAPEVCCCSARRPFPTPPASRRAFTTVPRGVGRRNKKRNGSIVGPITRATAFGQCGRCRIPPAIRADPVGIRNTGSLNWGAKEVRNLH